MKLSPTMEKLLKHLMNISGNIVRIFVISPFHEINDDLNSDNINKTVTKRERYISTLTFKNKLRNKEKIIFQNVSIEKFASIIKKPNTKSLRTFLRIFPKLFFKNLNCYLRTGSFPEDLKYVDVVLTCKKNKIDKI